MREPTTQSKVDYFRLPRPLWRKLKKHLPKKRNKSKRGGRPRVSDRALANAIWCVLWSAFQWKAIHREWFGLSSSVVHERFQRWRRMGIFEKLMKWMVEHYAKESGGISWKWQAMDSKNSPAPLGGEKTGKNPTDRGKQGAKINLLVDQRGAPLSVVLSGANRHDKISAIDLMVSVALKRPPLTRSRAPVRRQSLRCLRGEAVRCLGRLHDPHQGQPQKEGSHRIERSILTARGLSWGASSGEEMGGGADDLLANQASQPAHSLVQEGRELAGIDSVGLCPRVAQLGGFRIES
jgi:transposase